MITPRLPSVPPGDFPARRWDQLRRDAADFLASPWAMEAARFGWTDLDLFGVDADRPYTRLDGMGLLPALDGCKIVALSAEGATLETPGGVRQSYRRKAGRPGQALVWKPVAPPPRPVVNVGPAIGAI